MSSKKKSSCDCDVCKMKSDKDCSEFFNKNFEPKKTNKLSEVCKQFKKEFGKENCGKNANCDSQSENECESESGCESEPKCQSESECQSEPECEPVCKPKKKCKPIKKPKCKPIKFEPICIPKIHCKRPKSPTKPESCPPIPKIGGCDFPPLKKHKFKKIVSPCDENCPPIKCKKPCACEPIPEDWTFPKFPKMCDDCNFDACDIKSKFYKECNFSDFPKFPDCDTPDFDCEMNNCKFDSSIKSFHKE
jgi:hypothetical protein